MLRPRSPEPQRGLPCFAESMRARLCQIVVGAHQRSPRGRAAPLCSLPIDHGHDFYGLAYEAHNTGAYDHSTLSFHRRHHVPGFQTLLTRAWTDDACCNCEAPRLKRMSLVPSHGAPECYPSRSAVSGFTFDARRAGTRHATAATTIMTIGTATNVSGSCGLMPYRNADSSRTPDSATAKPNSTPMPTIQSICRRTSATMSRACAPRTDRTPISRVRCATLNDSTPNRPTPAISRANTPNHASTTAYSRGFARLVITRSSIVITESSARAGAC